MLTLKTILNLLSRAGGTYESLWDRQTGAFLEAD